MANADWVCENCGRDVVKTNTGEYFCLKERRAVEVERRMHQHVPLYPGTQFDDCAICESEKS
jgi:hypothetical protein